MTQDELRRKCEDEARKIALWLYGLDEGMSEGLVRTLINKITEALLQRLLQREM